MEEKKETVEKAPEPTVEPAKKGKGLIIGLVVVILLLIGGLAFAFYEINTLKEDNKTSEKRSKKDKEEDEEEEKEEKKSTKKKEETKKSNSDLLAPITADGKAFNISPKNLANFFVEFVDYADTELTVQDEFLELSDEDVCGDYNYCGVTTLLYPGSSESEYVVFNSKDGGRTVSEVYYMTKSNNSQSTFGFLAALVFTSSVADSDMTELVQKMSSNGCFTYAHCKMEYKGIGIEVLYSSADNIHKYSLYPAGSK